MSECETRRHSSDATVRLWAFAGSFDREQTEMLQSILLGLSIMLPDHMFDQSLVYRLPNRCTEVLSSFNHKFSAVDVGIPLSSPQIDYHLTSWREVAGAFNRREFPGQVTSEFNEKTCGLMR